MTHALPLARIRAAVHHFVAWLDRYGETSHDKESFLLAPKLELASDDLRRNT